jgi:hypothetical protein
MPRHTMKSRKIIPITLAVAATLSLGSLQCNHENCEELRDELSTLKNQWAECTRSEECVIVGGNDADCTGVLSCNFAVHRQHRLTAERRVASLPEDSVDCMVCNSPNCERGELPYCEPISGRCMIITKLIEPEDGDAEADAGTPMQSVTGGSSGDDDDDEPVTGEGGGFGSQLGSGGEGGAN